MHFHSYSAHIDGEPNCEIRVREIPSSLGGNLLVLDIGSAGFFCKVEQLERLRKAVSDYLDAHYLKTQAEKYPRVPAEIVEDGEISGLNTSDPGSLIPSTAAGVPVEMVDELETCKALGYPVGRPVCALIFWQDGRKERCDLHKDHEGPCQAIPF